LAKQQPLTGERLKSFLDERVDKYNSISFIENDPISIPHRFTKKQDIEISGFWIAMLSWGLRKTIINKGSQLMELMDHAPYDFIVNHKEKDRKAFLAFKHRTFNDIDTLYFLEFLQHHYTQHKSLEYAFLLKNKHFEAKESITAFHHYFFSLESAPSRTRKHVASPAKKSTAKRLNMFLRWMVRKDNKGVDFGLWNKIPSSNLMMPLDVHVDKVARHLGLLSRKQTDWKSVEELTNRLKEFDPTDPVKYDYALFGIGILEKDQL